ncbi:MAG: aldehyde dehydrogenase family protein, partial [Acidimicrobiia bacterium]|nr:aldehyde dehydrogenase family protein [Acidimicrobiia bacterium]
MKRTPELIVDFDQLLIDGEWRPAVDGATWDLVNPADETLIGTVAFGGATDATAAIDAAARVADTWAAAGPHQRAAVLHR